MYLFARNYSFSQLKLDYSMINIIIVNISIIMHVVDALSVVSVIFGMDKNS